MARNSQDVAVEVLDLVQRFSHDPSRCAYLLATKLEVIYDCAFALGYRQGKQFATEYSYGLGFTEGASRALAPKISHKNSNIFLAESAPPKRLAAKVETIQSGTKKEKALYRLPCSDCGAFYTEEECPLCKR